MKDCDATGILTRILTLEHAPLLFGRDPSPGLVAFDLADGGRAIRLHRRAGAATVTETVPFSPFMLLADRELVKNAPGLLDVDALEGPGALRWRARFGSWAEALGARDRCREQSGQLWNAPGAPYLFTENVEFRTRPVVRGAGARRDEGVVDMRFDAYGYLRGAP